MTDLILLHGALGAREQFDPLIRQLESGFRVHTFNFSGHGERPFAERFGTVQFAEEALAYLDEQGLSRAGLFGYSMGGYVALALARLHPDRVSRVATLATKFDWTPEGARREAAMLDPDRMLEKAPRYAETLRQRHADWRELLAATAEMMLDLGDRPLLTPAVLQSIGQPVLVLVGEADRMVSRGESADAARAVPDGRLLVLPGAPHPLEQVDVDVLAGHLRDFFA